MLKKQTTKYIGIDYGKKRTGISISDFNKVISFPLDTIETKNLIFYLKDLIVNEKIEKVVIGKPLKLNNDLHELENDIIQFIKSIKSIFPKIIIDSHILYFDTAVLLDFSADRRPNLFRFNCIKFEFTATQFLLIFQPKIS